MLNKSLLHGACWIISQNLYAWSCIYIATWAVTCLLPWCLGAKTKVEVGNVGSILIYNFIGECFWWFLRLMKKLQIEVPSLSDEAYVFKPGCLLCEWVVSNNPTITAGKSRVMFWSGTNREKYQKFPWHGNQLSWLEDRWERLMILERA